MAEETNPNKRKNGGNGTKLGNFLRSINFSDVAEVVGNVATGNIKGALEVLSNSEELSEVQMKLALQELEYDMVEMQEVTKRLETDNEHLIPRLVRPVTYGLMFIIFMFMALFDGNMGSFTVNKMYINPIESLFTTMTVFYFGSRGLEKMMKTFKK